VQGKTRSLDRRSSIVEWDAVPDPEQGLKWLVDGRNQLVHHLDIRNNAVKRRWMSSLIQSSRRAIQRLAGFDRSLRLMVLGR
jgi:hypothetical protein